VLAAVLCFHGKVFFVTFNLENIVRRYGDTQSGRLSLRINCKAEEASVCGVQPQTACSTYLCCAQWPCPCPCPCPLGESIFQSMERNMTASSFYSCELTVNRFISRFYTSSFLFIKFPSRWLDHVMTFYHFSYPFVQSGYNVTLLTCTCICVCLRFIKRESGSAMKCFMAVVGSLK
jgi:hypothetical protein